MNSIIRFAAQVLPWHVHQFGTWTHVEVPIWRHFVWTKEQSIGDRPTYDTARWVLHGKLMEQRRTCSRCGFTELKATRTEVVHYGD